MSKPLERPVLKAMLMRQAAAMVDMVGKQEPPSGVTMQLRRELEAAVTRALAAFDAPAPTDKTLLGDGAEGDDRQAG